MRSYITRHHWRGYGSWVSILKGAWSPQQPRLLTFYSPIPRPLVWEQDTTLRRCHVGKPIGCLAKVERRNSVVVGIVKDLGPDLPTPLLVLMRGKERRGRKEGEVERGSKESQ